MKMKKIVFDANTFLLVSTLICIFVLSIFGMQVLFPQIDQSKTEFIMELIKILFSSLLSAAVAYCVSIIQLKNAINRDEEKESQINKNRIRLLIIEIQDNEDVLNKVKKNNFPSNTSDLLKSQISFRVLNMFFDKLILNDTQLEEIVKYEKKLSLFISYPTEEMNSSFETIMSQFEDVKSKLKMYVS
ncbi:hypothetical protein YS9_2308 [Enterococcus sp. C1]|nr:hypothetical protein YS9_2308 [Enterococcus sp. C1]